MPSFAGLAIVAAVAFAAPLAIGLLPDLRVPSVVLEIVLGILSSGPRFSAGCTRTGPCG